MLENRASILSCKKQTHLLPATVRESPIEVVDKSNFTDDTPKRMQTTITWGKNANLMRPVSDIVPHGNNLSRLTVHSSEKLGCRMWQQPS